MFSPRLNVPIKLNPDEGEKVLSKSKVAAENVGSSVMRVCRVKAEYEYLEANEATESQFQKAKEVYVTVQSTLFSQGEPSAQLARASSVVAISFASSSSC